MGISLVTFSGRTVTPQDDALVYESALEGSGIIYGGTVTIASANTLHVAAAHGVLCGRKFTIEETDIPVALTPSGSLLGRLYIHMDLGDVDEPISFQVETGNTLTPVIQDSDVNVTNGVYEINLAEFDVDTSSISNLVNCAPYSKKILTATLLQGQTALTIQDVSILENAHYKFETEIYGVAPQTAVVTRGQIDLTFKAQDSDMGVIVTITN